MFGKRSVLKLSAVVAAVATIFIVAACSSTPPKKSWEQQFNDEISSMDINLGSAQEPPAFEFSMNAEPPHFSMILCKGASDDSRVQEDAWNTFFNEARKHGPAESYKPDFSDAGEEDGMPITRVMMFVNLKDDANASVAQDVAHKMVKVMEEFSPCK